MSTATLKTGSKSATAKVSTAPKSRTTTTTSTSKAGTAKTATTKSTTVKDSAPTAAAEIDRSGDTVSGRFTLRNLPTFDAADATKPLYAAFGVADFALEQVKDVPADVRAEAERVQSRLAEVPNKLQELPSQVKTYREDVEERVSDIYAKLALRGERLVTQIRRQPATEAAIAEGKEAVRKPEAAATAAKKSFEAGEQAVEDASAKIG